MSTPLSIRIPSSTTAVGAWERLRHGSHQAADTFRDTNYLSGLAYGGQQHFEYVHACSEVLLVLLLAIAPFV